MRHIVFLEYESNQGEHGGSRVDFEEKWVYMPTLMIQ
jgi:hypothetical protein